MRSLMLSMISMAVLTIETAADKGPNLVPAQPATAPNYWCTWYAQNYWIGHGDRSAGA